MIDRQAYPGGVWLVDFEFHPANHHEGNVPQVVCMVAREYFTGRTHRLWQSQLTAMAQPPFPTDATALLVAYYASAELGCFSSLGWAPPVNVLDLFTVFRCATNGLPYGEGHGLLSALAVYSCADPGIDKAAMRQRILLGAPWSASDQSDILAYCESDVIALAGLLPTLLPAMRQPRDLLYGRFMVAAADIERRGIPVDHPTFLHLSRQWVTLKQQLIQHVDRGYGVYVGEAFNEKKFAAYLAAQRIPWPLTAQGRLETKDETFKEQALAYPQLRPLRELRKTLSAMKNNDVPVGQDGRNRTLLSAFRSKTGRNQPSNSKFLFGLPAWMRGLIQPPAGWGLAYIDYSQQEFGIAAALSGDIAMMAAYASGDPYLEFAKQAGAVPSSATKHTHPEERSRYKLCAIGVLYGMAAERLARQIQQSPAHAQALIDAHRRTYQQFWHWSDQVSWQAQLGGAIHTVYGWPLHYGPDANDRSIRNFPMQANGAEMLRLACIRLYQDGVRVCAPVHDALLIEAPLAELEASVIHTQAVMAAASRSILGGFALRSDALLIRPGERYMDERGVAMWNTVMQMIGLPQNVIPP